MTQLAADPEVTRLRNELSQRMVDQEEKVRMGKLVKLKLDQRRDRLAEDIVSHLRALSASYRVHPVLAEAQIVTVSLLAARNDDDKVAQAVRELDKRYGGALHFKIIGPLPPHSFCTLGIRKPATADLLRARQVLGLPTSASAVQIQAAYRRLVAERHPDRIAERHTDRVTSQSLDQFLELQAAYRLINEFVQHAPILLGDTDQQVFFVEEVIPQASTSTGTAWNNLVTVPAVTMEVGVGS
ncbi:MAG: GvpL/GvpF family gas vesicle protein [Cyanobacteria bacterium NC_groundwater_1444_Ag_S-0.65um_54_12]|nr:GvpL/GvpF family gas vesicle protein [Cyanobacteria bacterium NC_groundwater_1444_Ag_S-0.65um_54_12]